MSSQLPDVSPMPLAEVRRVVLSECDVFEIIKGLKPGWYTTDMLYPRMLAWATSKGRHPAKLIQLAVRLRGIVGPENVHVVSGKNRAYRLGIEDVDPSSPRKCHD